MHFTWTIVRRSAHARHSACEALEHRCLMAGDVTFSITRGDLRILGDEEDNLIEISQLVAGTVRVTGLDDTTVNGQAFVELPGFADDAKILMRQGGEDQVTILGQFDVLGELFARIGDGSFTLDGTAGAIRIGDELELRGGESGDITIRNDVRVADETEIKTTGRVDVVAGQATLPDFSAAVFSDSLTIDNPYFPIVPGAVYTYEKQVVDDDTGQPVTETTVVEVLSTTRTIAGVTVREVRDRVTVGGLLVEDTFDFFAQDDNGNVWYLGEEVTNFEYDDNGTLIGTNDEGSFQAGVNIALAGIVMEANPQIGDRYYQEFAPRDGALDQAEVLAKNETATTPVATFNNVLLTEDFTILEPEAIEHKFYAPGLGPVITQAIDHLTGEVLETARLISVTLNGTAVTQVVPTNSFTGTNATGQVTVGIEFDGEVEIRSASAIVVRGAQFHDEAWLRCELAASVFDSILEASARIHGSEFVNLRSVTASMGTQVSGDGDVAIVDSEFHARVKISMADGDNSVTVEDSEFTVLDVRGGAGDNKFEDEGGNTFGNLKLKGFA